MLEMASTNFVRLYLILPKSWDGISLSILISEKITKNCMFFDKHCKNINFPNNTAATMLITIQFISDAEFSSKAPVEI